MKQCDKAWVTTFKLPLTVGAVGKTNHLGQGRNNGFRCRSNAALKRHPCHTCCKFGHWKDCRNIDGSLKTGVKCCGTAEKFSLSFDSGTISLSSGNNDANGKRKTVSFNVAVLSGNNCSTNETIKPRVYFLNEAIWQLVDEAAPHSPIGNVEFRIFSGKTGHNVGLQLESIPMSLNGNTHW